MPHLVSRRHPHIYHGVTASLIAILTTVTGRIIVAVGGNDNLWVLSALKPSIIVSTLSFALSYPAQSDV